MKIREMSTQIKKKLEHCNIFERENKKKRLRIVSDLIFP